jgi:hypothetical protein
MSVPVTYLLTFAPVHRDVPPKDQFEDLGYPKPSISMLNGEPISVDILVPFLQLCCILNNYHTSCLQPDGMILINTFEEPFGDEYGNGVWSELSGAVSSSIQENTVALASFNGNFVVLCYYFMIYLYCRPLFLFCHS